MIASAPFGGRYRDSMDRILLTAFLTALAGFITAALSIVKLVNEKESKTPNTARPGPSRYGLRLQS